MLELEGDDHVARLKVAFEDIDGVFPFLDKLPHVSSSWKEELFELDVERAHYYHEAGIAVFSDGETVMMEVGSQYAERFEELKNKGR